MGGNVAQSIYSSETDDLARCDREISELLLRPDNIAGRNLAYIVTMGVMDWTVERDWLSGGPGVSVDRVGSLAR